jgi:AcrR family transcriptional regulator
MRAADPKIDSSQSSQTKQRLLDAAEELIAVHGVAGVSLREITLRAGVNLALVKYHFRSKEGLVEAVLARRLVPIGRQRLALLDEVERRNPRGTLPLEAVLEALIRPVVEEGLNDERHGRTFLRVMGRLFAEPPGHTMKAMRKHLMPTIQRFDAAFARALPDLNEDEMGWRKIAGFGVVQHTLLMLSNLKELPFPLRLIRGRAPRPQKVTRRLVAFCAAGMRSRIAED